MVFFFILCFSNLKQNNNSHFSFPISFRNFLVHLIALLVKVKKKNVMPRTIIQSDLRPLVNKRISCRVCFYFPHVTKCEFSFSEAYALNFTLFSSMKLFQRKHGKQKEGISQIPLATCAFGPYNSKLISSGLFSIFRQNFVTKL